MITNTERHFWDGAIETLSPEDLAAFASRKLVDQLAYVAARSEFYAGKLGAADVDIAQVRGVADLERLPFTEKEELRASQEEAPPLGRHAAVGLREVVRVHAPPGRQGARASSPSPPTTERAGRR